MKPSERIMQIMDKDEVGNKEYAKLMKEGNLTMAGVAATMAYCNALADYLDEIYESEQERLKKLAEGWRK